MKFNGSFFAGSVTGNIQVIAGLVLATRLGPAGAFIGSILIYWLGLYATKAIADAFSKDDKKDDSNQV